MPERWHGFAFNEKSRSQRQANCGFVFDRYLTALVQQVAVQCVADISIARN